LAWAPELPRLLGHAWTTAILDGKSLTPAPPWGDRVPPSRGGEPRAELAAADGGGWALPRLGGGRGSW